MYIFDSHVHTKYSFDGARDGSGELDAIAEAAIAAGVSEIALCDHYDIDCVLDGLYPPFDADAVAADIRAAKERWAGKLRINVGVELGQAHTRSAEAGAVLDRIGYDFVIGSLHNLRAYPDFSQLRLSHFCNEQLCWLMRRMLSETLEIIRFGRISTLAHVTYIDRYLREFEVGFDLRPYYDGFREIFYRLIDAGIALECNTSGLRRGSVTMPDYDLLALYRECGGELLTLGSDAHSARDIGKGIEEAAAVLRDLGFTKQCVPRDGALVSIEL